MRLLFFITIFCLFTQAHADLTQAHSSEFLFSPEFKIQSSKLARSAFNNPDKKCHKISEYLQETMNSYSLHVIRNGQPVIDIQKEPFAPDQVFKLFSASKLVTALMLGAVLKQNSQWSLDTLVAPYVNLGYNSEDWDPEKRKKIKLKHLVSMSTGFEWCEYAPCGGVDPLRSFYGARNEDALSFVLSKKLVSNPGYKYSYSSGNYIILSAFLRNALGEKKYKKLYQDYLFKPLGIENSVIETDGKGLYLGASGIWLSAKDFAKMGQLLIDKGRWKGRPLIDESYVQYMVSMNKSMRRSSQGVKNWEGPAGASIWLNLKENGFPQSAPGLPESMVFSTGLFGQFLYAFPEQNLVISHFGGDSDYGSKRYKFIRNAARCFGPAGIYKTEKEPADFEAPVPFVFKIDGLGTALVQRLPMNAYAQEMCSCLFVGGTIGMGTKEGVEYCKEMRPLPEAVASRQSFKTTINSKEKTVRAFFSDEPKKTFAEAKFFPGKACKLTKIARPYYANENGVYEELEGDKVD